MTSSTNKIKFNWLWYAILAITIRVFFPEISWYSYIAILISLHQFLYLFFSIGFIIPIRYIFGTFMCLQMFIGPMFQYNGLDKFVPSFYSMKIPEDIYFSYVIPAVVCFIIGLHIKAVSLQGEVADEKAIINFIEKHSDLPIIFVVIGFFFSFFLGFVIEKDFSTSNAVETHGGIGWLSFIFYLLGNLKFIGVFMMILGKVKMKSIFLIIIYGSIMATSLNSGMFHDLITWLIMLAAVLAIRYKPALYIKIILAFSFIIFAFALQTIKGIYRLAVWENKREAGIATFTQAAEESESSGNILDVKRLAILNVRINQGYIITNIMNTVPYKIPYTEGEELMQILAAAFLPRYLAPDKLEAGDKKIFNKYTGLTIVTATMALSSVGDAYINFGILGGCVFMFFLGLLYNELLKFFYRYSKNFPILIIFIPWVFYYPIRPDCELQTTLGHIVKTSFLVAVIFIVWTNAFKILPQKLSKQY